jgi:acetyl esterase/lipase
MIKKISLLRLFVGVFCVGFSLCYANTVPIEYFSQLPDVSTVSLSPNGKKIASLVRVDIPGQKGISAQVTDLETGKSKQVLFSDNTSYVIYDLYWKDDKTLLAHGFAALNQKAWGGGAVKYKIRATRLLFVDSETGEVTKPFTDMFMSQFSVAPAGLDYVVDPLPDDPDHVLMVVYSGGLKMAAGLSYGAVYKVNIHTGVAKPLKGQPTSFVSSYTDRQHRLRAGYYLKFLGLRERKFEYTVKFLDIESDKWMDLTTFEGVLSEDDLDILGFSEDPNELYVNAYHNDRRAVFKINLKDKELKKVLVHADERYDVYGSLIYSHKLKKVIGVSGGEEADTVFFEEKFNAIKEKLKKLIPGTRNYMYEFSDDLSKFLVYSTGPTESGTYYLGQTSPLKVQALAYRYKSLTPDVLSKVQRVRYKARDGLEIEAFLTLPKGRSEKKLPTLMFPHGGPIARDSEAFDYWAQFFASKGYAVLQMNFRGSAGQGYSHMKAGLKKWGKEMQDDVEDGARYLMDKGIADPDKIAIVGASYGGYAALMGTVRTPDFYKCAISVNGVSDVYELVLEHRAFWRNYNAVDEQIGRDRTFLKEISPINHVDKIKAPILLIHGESDRQVEPFHSEEMHKRLQKAGKPVEYLTLPDEDHYLSIEKNRVDTFKAMDRFLDKCLPVTKI